MADNGSAMYISGAPDSRWDNGDLLNTAGVDAVNLKIVIVAGAAGEANGPLVAPAVILREGCQQGEAGPVTPVVGEDWRSGPSE